MRAGAPGPVVARWESERPGGAGAEHWAKQTGGKWLWVDDPARERSQHPRPEVAGRWCGLADVGLPLSEPVLRLAEVAREGSWEVRVSYARGNGVHGSTGRPTAVRESVAVAFGRHPLTDAQAVAVYSRPESKGTWSWGSVWLRGPALGHFGLCSLAELKEWLAAGGQVPEDWYADVRARVAGVVDAKAARDARLKEIKADFAARLANKPADVSVEAGRRLVAEHMAGMAGNEDLSAEDILKIVKLAKAKKDHGD